MAAREFPLILQLDVSGNPHSWITYEESAYHIAKGNVAWAMGEVEFDIHGGKNSEGVQSKLTINTIMAVSGMPNKRAFEFYDRVPLRNKILFRRDQHICAYCGSHLPHGGLTRDHVIPTSRGGANTWTNVVAACSPCNKLKDNMTPEEAGMQLLYVPYVPNRCEWLILGNRNILADQMEFLLKRVPPESRLHKAN